MEVPRKTRQEQDRQRADGEDDAPGLRSDVGDREEDDGDGEAGTVREREHRQRVGACAVGRLFHCRDPRDDQRRVHERPGQHLRAGEHDDARCDRRDRVGDADTREADQEQAPASLPVGERGRDE